MMQERCCAHEMRLECVCPQGYRSHAMDEDEQECDCGAIKMAESPWQNCSGMTHVFQPGADRCVCLKRFAGVERV